jgi:hypothetical protein
VALAIERPIGAFRRADERLAVPAENRVGLDRGDDPTAGANLFDHAVGNRTCPTGQVRRVVGSTLGQAFVTVARLYLDVLVAQFSQAVAGRLGEIRVVLDASYLVDEFGRDGGVIPTAGTDLENAVARPGRK